MQPTETLPDKPSSEQPAASTIQPSLAPRNSHDVNEEQPQQAGWWQQFWWRYSPNGELPLSSAASWIVHLFVFLLAWAAAVAFIARDRQPPRVDVVSLGMGDGIGRGPAGGGDGLPPGDPGDTAASVEFQSLSRDSDLVERREDRIELSDLPKTESEKTRLKPADQIQLTDRDSERQMRETDTALREASNLLRQTLEANQNRGQGKGGAGGGTGVGKGLGVGSGSGPGTGRGNLDANSTPGRQARWVITYPTLPQGEYERMLDFFHIELAYLESDRKSMQYLSNLSGVGKKREGDAADENRMFWYWMGQNRLAEADGTIMLRHGLSPASEIVHLYSKELELKLADMERDYLRRQFKTADVERIATTNFKIVPSGANGWRLEVTGLSLR